MTYRGQVKNGVIVLEAPAQLPEGATVEVIAPAPTRSDAIPSLYDQLEDLIGKAKGLPPDLAENHDHYIHGRPKRK